MTDDERILRAYQARVEKFGGRVGLGDQKDLWKQLQSSNLGSSEVLPTGQANPTFPRVITLAEMKLKRAVCVDVVFSLLGTEAGPGDLFFNLGVSQGDGFVRVTWGSGQGPQHSVNIDSNYGWRHPFCASYLRVEYIPIDDTAAVQWHVQGGQPRDMRVQASIVPAAGGATSKLTKTMFFADIPDGGFDQRAVPPWATNYWVSMQTFPPSSTEVVITPTSAVLAFSLGERRIDNIAGSQPAWQMTQASQPMPQQARTIFIGATAGTGQIVNPMLICELAL